MDQPRPKWVEAMWQELSTLSETEQVSVSGAWITLMTNELLTELGHHRRVLVAGIVARPGWDAMRLAETIGGRRASIVRLAEDGRRIRRERERRERGQPDGFGGPEG